jgi:amino acid permease
VLKEGVELVNTLELKTFKSMFMTILQIINSIIRYTIVQFPFCIKTLGLVYGPLIISLVGVMSIFSIYMLIEVKQATSKK